MIAFVLALALVGNAPAPVPTPAPVDAAPSQPAPAPATVAASPPAAPLTPAPPKRKPRVLVLEPTSSSVDEDTKKAIASVIVAELELLESVEVISATEIQKLANLEAQKQAVGCDQTGCLAELAGAIGAELVVFGDVTKLGEISLLNLQLFDAATTRPVSRAQEQIERPEDMPMKVRMATRTLTAQLRTETTSSSLGLVILGGAGAAIFVGGLALDVLSSTSHNDSLDYVDLLAPAIWISGAAAAGVAVALYLGGE